VSKERYGDPTTPLEDIFTLPLAYQDIEGRFGVKNQGLPSGVSGEGLGSKIPGYVEILERKKLKHQKFQISKMFRTTSRNTLGMRARPPPAPARLQSSFEATEKESAVLQRFKTNQVERPNNSKYFFKSITTSRLGK